MKMACGAKRALFLFAVTCRIAERECGAVGAHKRTLQKRKNLYEKQNNLKGQKQKIENSLAR